MKQKLNQRLEQLEERIGIGKQYACYIDIRVLPDDTGEETSRRIHLAGRLWATAERSPSPFSEEQITKLKTEFGKLTPDELAAQEETPLYIHTWPNGHELRTNVDFL